MHWEKRKRIQEEKITEMRKYEEWREKTSEEKVKDLMEKRMKESSIDEKVQTDDEESKGMGEGENERKERK